MVWPQLKESLRDRVEGLGSRQKLIRIQYISARRANRSERKKYEQEVRKRIEH